MNRDDICEKFLDSLEFDLYAYQEEGLLAWFEADGGLLICAPTGMGKTLLAEARKHREWRLIKTCPGLGPIRTAELLPVVVTPYRFQSRSHFWAYSGLGIVMRSSSDWVRDPSGRWVKAAVQQTRGLNRNSNRTLKGIFKGAATTVIGQAKDEPLYRHYLQLLDGGTKPNLAKLTLARQVASIMLAVWRNEEVYDPARVGQAV